MRTAGARVVLDRCMTQTAAYGTWTSPISAADVAKAGAAVSYPSVAGGEVWWQERRPSEGGRTAIVAAAGPGATPRDLLPEPWNARTRVHEYGGKSYLPCPRCRWQAGSTSCSPTSPTSGCTRRARQCC